MKLRSFFGEVRSFFGEVRSIVRCLGQCQLEAYFFAVTRNFLRFISIVARTLETTNIQVPQ